MANGMYPKTGWVATSDRSIPFGTVIEIDNIKYKKGDHTALWVHNKFKHQTIDIFMPTGCDNTFGSNTKLIKIYEKNI